MAYIANDIVTSSPCNYADIDRKILFILCLLHDIGAYKTEEIDNMVIFETENVDQHAIYGYPFLKNTTPLAEYAEAILYHHTDRATLKEKTSAYENYAQIIHLADRADILLNTDESATVEKLISEVPLRFSEQIVRDLITAENMCKTSEAIRSGEYIHTVDKLIANVNMSAEDAMQYLKMIVFSIDFRSLYTLTHTIDVAVIATELGKILQLGENETEQLYLGCFLHDIGKIAIPYSILEKESSLTDDEMATMRRHVSYTYDILLPVNEKHVCDIASNHHEKTNGKGYPKGLTKDDLSLSERIAAVADVASALVNKRSYKESFGKTKTIGIIKDMKDKGELCPAVCDAFTDNFDEIMCVVRTNDDAAAKLHKRIYDEYALRTSELLTV